MFHAAEQHYTVSHCKFNIQSYVNGCNPKLKSMSHNAKQLKYKKMCNTKQKFKALLYTKSFIHLKTFTHNANYYYDPLIFDIWIHYSVKERYIIQWMDKETLSTQVSYYEILLFFVQYC